MGTSSQLLSVCFVNGASVKLAGQGRTAEGRMAGGQGTVISTTEMLACASCVTPLKHLWC